MIRLIVLAALIGALALVALSSAAYAENVPVGDGGCTPGQVGYNIYGTGGVWYCTFNGWVRIG